MAPEKVNLEVSAASDERIIVQLASEKHNLADLFEARAIKNRNDAKVTIDAAGGKQFSYGSGTDGVMQSPNGEVIYDRQEKGAGTVIWRANKNSTTLPAVLSIIEDKGRSLCFKGEPPDPKTAVERAADLLVRVSHKMKFGKGSLVEYELCAEPSVLKKNDDDLGLLISLALDTFWMYREGHDGVDGYSGYG